MTATYHDWPWHRAVRVYSDAELGADPDPANRCTNCGAVFDWHGSALDPQPELCAVCDLAEQEMQA